MAYPEVAALPFQAAAGVHPCQGVVVEVQAFLEDAEVEVHRTPEVAAVGALLPCLEAEVEVVARPCLEVVEVVEGLPYQVEVVVVEALQTLVEEVGEAAHPCREEVEAEVVVLRCLVVEVVGVGALPFPEEEVVLEEEEVLPRLK